MRLTLTLHVRKYRNTVLLHQGWDAAPRMRWAGPSISVNAPLTLRLQSALIAALHSRRCVVCVCLSVSPLDRLRPQLPVHECRVTSQRTCGGVVVMGELHRARLQVSQPGHRCFTRVVFSRALHSAAHENTHTHTHSLTHTHTRAHARTCTHTHSKETAPQHTSHVASTK
jgi:hypothetical protein